MTNHMITEVTDETFAAEVDRADGAVLVDFGADWCIDCRMLAPVLAEIAADYAGRLKVCTVDVDANKAVAERFRISTIPVLILFAGGREAAKLVNVKDKLRIAAMLADTLGLPGA